ncbi:MAG: MFS transporter [Chloroflexota bacterium]|jgi:predicted MFS family arabinose efflux permease|nr:MFS transporter [Chloroflexota bacterium]
MGSTERGGQRLKDQKAASLRVLVLALATFAVGTGTFIVTGLLGGVARDLSVSVGTAGHLVTVFAVAFAVLSPVLVAATARVGRRRLLVTAMVLFALANAAAALAPTFSLLLLSRVAAACLAAICTPVAVATAAQLAPPEHKGRALSVTIGGISMAWVVGVSSGAMVVDHLGWRVSFALTAGLALFAAIAVGTLLPRVKGAAAATGGLASRLAVAGRPAVLATLLVTVLAMVSGFTVLTYVRPMLEGLTGFEGGGIGSMLLLFGLAAMVGSVLGGYGADRWGYRATVVPVLVVQAFALLSFSLLPAAATGSAFLIIGAAGAMAAWGVVSFALVPLQQYRLIGVAPEEQSGVLSLNSSAVFAGQGLGAGFGSLVLGHSSPAALGYVGAVFAAAALVVLVLGTMPLSIRRAAELEAPAKPIGE